MENERERNISELYEPLCPDNAEADPKLNCGAENVCDAENICDAESRVHTENGSCAEGSSVENSRQAEGSGRTGSRGGRREKKPYTLTRKGLACMLCGCMLLSAVFGFSGAFAAQALTGAAAGGSSKTSSVPASSVAYDGLAAATGSELSIQEIIAMNENAVVEIRTEQVATDSWMMQYITEGAGSGVIISKDGMIVTNNHVIEGASKITVRLKNGTEYQAKVVGADSETDVALISIDANGLTAAVYGNSDELAAGDLAVAIGNPLGQLGGTATAGIISATDREMKIDGKSMTLLQTDASINPGNSGGGLFNQKGELVGIVVAKSTGSNVEGLGFAIPINTVKEVAQQLSENGYVKGRPALGITFVDLTSARNAILYGVRNTGIYVRSLDSENAKASGLKEGDMLYYINDTKITDADTLLEAVSKCKIGEKVKLTVVRGDETLELTLKVSEKNS